MGDPAAGQPESNPNKDARQGPARTDPAQAPGRDGLISTPFAQAAHARNLRDRRGYPVHLWCAMIGLIAMLSWDGVAEFLVWLPVAACTIRVIPTRWCVLWAVGSWGGLCALAVVAYSAAGLLWSADPGLGFQEWGKFRHALVAIALWPLMADRRWLVAALMIGFGLGHLTQFGHAVGGWLGVEWLRWPRLADRNSGWWDPVVGGSLVTAAVGLHLAVLMDGRGRWRWVGAAGMAAALAGVVATGTRGAWIASGVLVGAGVVVAVVRMVRVCARAAGGETGGAVAHRGGRSAWMALGVLVVGVGVGVVVAGPVVLERGERAVGEVRAALVEERYESDTGRRLLMWREGFRAWLARPMEGVGPGGLRAWAEADVASRGVDPALLLDHAHGMWVHALATGGIVGVGLWALLVAVAVGGGRRVADGGGWAGACAHAPAWALTGLLLAGVFDSVHINSQTSMLLWVLLVLCAGGGSLGVCPPLNRWVERSGR